MLTFGPIHCIVCYFLFVCFALHPCLLSIDVMNVMARNNLRWEGFSSLHVLITAHH